MCRTLKYASIRVYVLCVFVWNRLSLIKQTNRKTAFFCSVARFFQTFRCLFALCDRFLLLLLELPWTYLIFVYLLAFLCLQDARSSQNEIKLFDEHFSLFFVAVLFCFIIFVFICAFKVNEERGKIQKMGWSMEQYANIICIHKDFIIFCERFLFEKKKKEIRQYCLWTSWLVECLSDVMFDEKSFFLKAFRSKQRKEWRRQGLCIAILRNFA